MDDPLVRLAMVLAVGLLVVGIGVLRRARTNRVTIPRTGLAPGTYLFTSRTCADCAVARQRLAGETYTEVAWEENPEEFERLGIGEVPGVLVVSSSGDGTWRRGVPTRR